MNETYKMMLAARRPEFFEMDYNELVERFRETRDNAIFAEIFCKLYILICRKALKYPGLCMEDKVSFALLTLTKAINTYKLKDAPSKFVSYALLCIEREYISSYHSQNSNHKKVQFMTVLDSSVATQEDSRPIEKIYDDIRAKTAFDNIEFELVYKSLNLTPAERFFIKGVLAGMSTAEMAAAWKVTPARIHIIKDKLKKKVIDAAGNWDNFKKDSISNFELSIETALKKKEGLQVIASLVS